tara:strand:- start:77 stop:361 length:285 start_codon:yes stop_codon:yes gene_type:complete
MNDEKESGNTDLEKNENIDYSFDLSERSTRKATLYAVFFGFLSFILHLLEFGNLSIFGIFVSIILGVRHQFGGILLFLSSLWLLHFPKKQYTFN